MVALAPYLLVSQFQSYLYCLDFQRHKYYIRSLQNDFRSVRVRGIVKAHNNCFHNQTQMYFLCCCNLTAADSSDGILAIQVRHEFFFKKSNDTTSVPESTFKVSAVKVHNES